MNDDDEVLKTAALKVFKESQAAAGELEPYTMIWWDGPATEENRHPYWVIDYLEASGWFKYLPEPEPGESIDGITVEYNFAGRNDIRKLTLPDGEVIREP